MEFLTLGEDTGFQAKMIADSISPDGVRICTVTARYPRFVHSELMTHRAFARNAASSRAVPFKVMLRNVLDHPVIPIKWGAEQKGMQTGDEIGLMNEARCHDQWLRARDYAVDQATAMHDEGLHKSLCNRLLEPFSWITTVITATEWNNFFRLRCHDHAEIHLQKIAYMLRDLLKQSEPKQLHYGHWHLPFTDLEDIAAIGDKYSDPEVGIVVDDSYYSEIMPRLSAARCARVSYLTHEGERNIGRDLELFGKLSEGSGFGHWSPMEHPAQCARPEPVLGDLEEHASTKVGTYTVSLDWQPKYYGPFKGWKQYRKFFAQENLEGCTV